MKRTTVKLTKEERAAQKLADGDLLSSDFEDSLSGMSDGDGAATVSAAALAVGFQPPPLGAGEVGAMSR